MTLDVYAHLMKAENQKAAARLEKSVFGKNSSRMVAEIKRGLAKCHNPLILLVRTAGFEPAAYGFEVLR